MSLVLFETSESVIELLWDIALAFFILRIALAYFALVFASSILLSYALSDHLVPTTLLSPTLAHSELLALGSQALLMAFWARFAVVYFEVPRVLGFRLAIGFVAAAFLFAAEALVAFCASEQGLGGWMSGMEPAARLTWLGLLAAFALLPSLMMAAEKPVVDECEKCHYTATSHGQEKKPVTAAV